MTPDTADDTADTLDIINAMIDSGEIPDRCSRFLSGSLTGRSHKKYVENTTAISLSNECTDEINKKSSEDPSSSSLTERRVVKLLESEYERSKHTVWESILPFLTRVTITKHRDQSLSHQLCRKQVNYDGMTLITENLSAKASTSNKLVDNNHNSNSNHQYHLNKLLLHRLIGAGAYGHVIQGYIPKYCKSEHDKVAIKVDPESAFNVWECYINQLVSKSLIIERLPTYTDYLFYITIIYI